MLTAQFIMGLKEDLRFPVEMQLPDTVARVAVLASVKEKLLDKYQKKQSRWFGSKQVAPLSKGDSKTSFTPTELWKATQLRERMRVNGLCFKCGDKFAHGHKCTDKSSDNNIAQLSTLESETDTGGLI
jgi:hypothetical protein